MSPVTVRQLDRIEEKLDVVHEVMLQMATREASCQASTNQRLLNLERMNKWLMGIVATLFVAFMLAAMAIK